MVFDLQHKSWLRLQSVDRERLTRTAPISHPEDTERQVVRFGPVPRWSHAAMLLRQLAADAGVTITELAATVTP